MTPAIEQVKARQASIELTVDMQLASMPVTIIGQYNIHSNCFYPSTVIADGATLTLESYCLNMGWDYDETHDEIQNAVEQRDQ